MSKTQAVAVNDVLQEHPSETLAWARRVWSGQERAPADFNWLGLAEAAAFAASAETIESSSEQRRAWAELATAVYEYLARQGDDSARNAHTLSAMMLRALMISRLGTVKGDPVLDADRVVQWFFRTLPMAYTDAAAQSRSWWERDIGVVQSLRHIKNQLNVVRPLVEHGQVKPAAELRKWLSLQPALP